MDGTIAYLKKYQNETINVRLTIEKDSGIYDAMNKGIKMAKADWLYFIGADDYLSDKRSLEMVVAFVTENNTQLVYGDVIFKGLQKKYDGEFDIEKILTRNICHQAIFYHISSFNTMGYYDLRYRLHADYEFNIKCWLSGKIKHKYMPVTVCNFSDGGASSLQPDPLFIEDFPERTVGILMASDFTVVKKIYILATIYRKVFNRYPLPVLKKLVRNKGSWGLRTAAISWFVLSAPFFFIRKFFYTV